jgi:hypothetical protein
MKISNLQIVDGKNWSGIGTKNHIGSIFEQRPQLASTMMTRMLSRYFGNTLDTMLDTIPAKYLETDDDYIWKLIGSSERNIPLVEARFKGNAVTAADFGVGASGAAFELVFAERWFSDVNVIVGEKNEIYPIRITNDPYPEGNYWVYPVEMYGSAGVEGMPGEELIEGKRFSKDYSPVEDTLSIKGGETTFASPTTFRNTFSRIRMQYTVPGNMRNRKFIADFVALGKGGEKQTFRTWMDYQDWVFQYQFAQEKNRLLFYGRSTRDSKGQFGNVGKSGHSIEAGAGLREQMEVSNTFFYSHFSADFITNILMELSEGKLAMDERKFVIKTGERGAVLFHKAIAKEASGWTPLFDQSAMKKVATNLSSEGRQFGFQFVEYIAPNNIHVKIEVDPMYSDPVRNKIAAPNNGHFLGGLAESYRMDIFDIGTSEGEPNIQKVYATTEPDHTGYIPGLRNPFSPTNERSKYSLMATPKDGYEVHKIATCSAMIKDPSRTASLIPNILA